MLLRLSVDSGLNTKCLDVAVQIHKMATNIDNNNSNVSIMIVSIREIHISVSTWVSTSVSIDSTGQRST